MLSDLDANNHVIDRGMAWTVADDARVQKIRTDQAATVTMWTIGLVAIFGGTTIGIVGAVQRSRAIDRAQRAP